MPLAETIEKAMGSVADGRSSGHCAPKLACRNHTCSSKAYQSPPLHKIDLLVMCAYFITIHHELADWSCASRGDHGRKCMVEPTRIETTRMHSNALATHYLNDNYAHECYRFMIGAAVV